MAIVVTDYNSQEPLDYNHSNLVELRVTQLPKKKSADHTVFRMTYVYNMLAVDSSGSHYYSPEQYTIDIPDYIGKALERAKLGDSDLLDTLGSIEKTLATIQTELGSQGTAKVV